MFFFKYYIFILQLLVFHFLRDNDVTWRRSLFPFRKQAMPFLTVDAIIGNQAFQN